MSKQIKAECETKTTIALNKLEDFQGNLKLLSADSEAKLRKQIIESGFSFAVHVWLSPEGKVFILDGHQRIKVMKRLQEEGFKIPMIPVVHVKAKSVKEAKLKLLSATSQYGSMGPEGLNEFLEGAGIEVEKALANFQFPEIDGQEFLEMFSHFEEGTTKDSMTNLKGHDPMSRLMNHLTSDIRYMQLIFKEEEFEQVVKWMNQAQEEFDTKTHSEAMWALLESRYGKKAAPSEKKTNGTSRKKSSARVSSRRRN